MDGDDELIVYKFLEWKFRHFDDISLWFWQPRKAQVFAQLWFKKKKYPSVNYIAHCPIADLLNGIGSEQNIYSHYLTTKLYNVIQLYTNYSQHTCNHILWRSI